MKIYPYFWQTDWLIEICKSRYQPELCSLFPYIIFVAEIKPCFAANILYGILKQDKLGFV